MNVRLLLVVSLINASLFNPKELLEITKVKLVKRVFLEIFVRLICFSTFNDKLK